MSLMTKWTESVRPDTEECIIYIVLYQNITIEGCNMLRLNVLYKSLTLQLNELRASLKTRTSIRHS